MSERVCIEDGCGRGGKLARGMCGKHYRRWLDHTPLEQRGIAPRFVDNFWNCVQKSHEYGCWTWTDKFDRKGYGRWRKTLAHRESWRRAHGEIPDGLWVLHHCDNPPCVNPAHLYLGTVVENVRDMVDRRRNYIPPRRTHCAEGHELIGENLRIAGKLREVWLCRMCDNKRSAERQRQLRRARGVQPVNHVSAQERMLIIELHNGGMSQRAIGKQVGRALTTVQRALQEGRSDA